MVSFKNMFISFNLLEIQFMYCVRITLRSHPPTHTQTDKKPKRKKMSKHSPSITGLRVCQDAGLM